MSNQPRLGFLSVIIVIAAAATTGTCGEQFQVKIRTPATELAVGDSLILELRYEFKEPKLSPRTKKPLPTLRRERLLLDVRRGREETLQPWPLFLFLGEMVLQDKEGLKYSGHAEVFYNPRTKEIIFDKPGTYTVNVRDGRHSGAVPLKLTVKPASPAAAKAIELLSGIPMLSDDRDVLAYLLYGSRRTKEATKAVEQVARDCPDTWLGRVALARMGLERYAAFRKKHSSFERFKAMRDRGRLKEPLLDEARKYLNKAMSLPDESRIREEALYRLALLEFAAANVKKTFTLIEELGRKYPAGRYGKKASKMADELRRQQRAEQFEMQIAAPRKRVAVGEPLVIELRYRFAEPRVRRGTQEPETSVQRKYLWITIQRGKDQKVQSYPILPERLYLKDKEGLKYAGFIEAFYDRSYHKLYLDKPGTYIVNVQDIKKLGVPVEITVGPPTPSSVKAMTVLLNTPDNFTHLLFGRDATEKTKRAIKHVADTLGDTWLGRMACARLGTESYDAFRRKHPDLKKFQTLREAGKGTEPLFDNARKYLAGALSLPDTSKIREKLLYQSVIVEYVAGDSKKASRLAEELGKKYPAGSYGRASGIIMQRLRDGRVGGSSGKRSAHAEEVLRVLRAHKASKTRPAE